MHFRSDITIVPVNLLHMSVMFSLMPSCPHPPVGNVWWLELDFLSQRCVQQRHIGVFIPKDAIIGET